MWDVSGGVVRLGLSSIGLSLARTSLFFKEALFLYAITGGSGNILFFLD